MTFDDRAHKSIYGDVGANSGVIVGRGAGALSRYSASPNAFVDEAFRRVYTAIEEMPPAEADKRDEVMGLVHRIAIEVGQGDLVEPSTFELNLQSLRKASPSVFEMVTGVLTRPTRDIPTVVRERADKVRLLNQHGIEEPSFTVGNLAALIEGLEVHPDQKQHLLATIHQLDAVLNESTSAGTVKRAQRLLKELSSQSHELRRPVWYWLAEDKRVDSSLRMIARELLARDA